MLMWYHTCLLRLKIKRMGSVKEKAFHKLNYISLTQSIENASAVLTPQTAGTSHTSLKLLTLLSCQVFWRKSYFRFKLLLCCFCLTREALHLNKLSVSQNRTKALYCGLMYWVLFYVLVKTFFHCGNIQYRLQKHLTSSCQGQFYFFFLSSKSYNFKCT